MALAIAAGEDRNARGPFTADFTLDVALAIAAGEDRNQSGYGSGAAGTGVVALAIAAGEDRNVRDMKRPGKEDGRVALAIAAGEDRNTSRRPMANRFGTGGARHRGGRGSQLVKRLRRCPGAHGGARHRGGRGSQLDVAAVLT